MSNGNARFQRPGRAGGSAGGSEAGLPFGTPPRVGGGGGLATTDATPVNQKPGAPSYSQLLIDSKFTGTSAAKYSHVAKLEKLGAVVGALSCAGLSGLPWLARAVPGSPPCGCCSAPRSFGCQTCTCLWATIAT